MTEQELSRLLQDMTLEEKINQLLQLPGSYYKGDAAITGGMEGSAFTDTEISQAGSVLGIYGADTVLKLQKSYMERQPHHIPLLFMLDVIHGFRTIFPIPLAQGATFRPALTKECAKAAAKESAVSGVTVTFAPMADLVRDARWGRVMEATGEDPYLNSLMTVAMVQGFQGEHVGRQDQVAACVKHFAGYGAPTAGREYNNVELSEHALREYYLPAYEAGIRAGSELVMTSFNTLDGIPSSGNQWLMRQVLRKEMGFDGVLISDWGAVEEMIAHGFCEDTREAAKKAIEAGVDIDMATSSYCRQLAGLVESGEVEESLIEEAVLRVLRLKNRLGLFENPFKDADEEREKEVILSAEHRSLARTAVRESIVLLKNEPMQGAPLLPLDQSKKIAFIGPYVESQELHSAWAIAGRTEDGFSIRQAAEEVLGAEQVTFCPGCPMVMGTEHLSRHTLPLNTPPGTSLIGAAAAEEDGPASDKSMEAQAVKAAREADVVVFCMGEHRLQSGEAASRGEITVPEVQMELFRRVWAINPNVVAVIVSGRPLDLREIAQKAKAVLEVWMPGTEGGHGIVDVLTGEYNPSGRLPISFPYCTGQTPIHYNQYATGRPCRDHTGTETYRSRYLDIPNAPLYPFGFGLSYTTYTISPVVLSHKTMDQDQGELTASVSVKNTGNRVGTETVQLYIRDVTGSRVRPVKELRGFQKVTLEPGAECSVDFVITEDMLRFHTADGTFASEKGRFFVWVGESSNTDNQAEFHLI